jgi:tight adherence protein B
VTRRVVTALAGALAALAALAPFAAAEGPSLAETAGVRFPDRAYALSLPEAMPLVAAQVQVRENGELVRDVSLTPPESASVRRFGVVLAIDTSYSMRGRPLRAAVAAAREFVRQRAAGQPVALITFAGTVEVLLPFSTDDAAIERALDAVGQGGGGSRLVDAAGRAVELVRAARMPSGSVVLISDGADRASSATLDDVANVAASAGVRVYGIGLASESDDFGALNLLAARSSAEFSAVSSLGDLARVYRRLGSRLAHQYLVQYRSPAAPGREVRVEVTVDGMAGTAVTSYRSPAVARTVRPPFHHVPADRLLLQPAAVLILGLLVAGLVFAALWMLLRPRAGGLRERMAPYVREPEKARAERSGSRTPMSARLLHGAERSLDGRAWWDQFREYLDIGRIEIAPVRLLAWIGAGTLAGLLLLPLLGGSPVFALPAVAVPLGAWLLIRRRVNRQRRHFVDQLPDNMQVIASAMRAGHSFAGALAVVVDDAPEPTRRELQRVIADERLGIPLDVAMATAVRRMDSKDLEQVALVAVLQRETGGNTAEVLDRVTQTVRARLALRRMVASLTAQGRMSRWVLTAIPVFLLVMLSLINPVYMSPLYTTPVGRALLIVCALMVTAGSLVIKKIVDIKV